MAFKFNPTTGKFDIVSDPGGSDTQVQFNDGGSFGGDSDLTYNKTTNTLTTKGNIRLDDAGSFTTTLQAIPPTATRTISLPDATGTVALVAGSNGQILYNNAGVNAGIPQLTWNSSTGLTFSSNWIQSTNGAASAPPMSLTGSWFTGGTSTTTKPQLLIEPTGTTSNTWSTAGTGLGVNAPSGFTGNLATFGINGTERMRITASGNVGIGTTTPGVLLEVNGAMTAQGNIFAASGGATRTITLGPAGAGLEYATDGTTYLGGRTDAYPLVFRTNSAERMRIDSSGRVSFGTNTNPTGTTLLSIACPAPGISGDSVSAGAVATATNAYRTFDFGLRVTGESSEALNYRSSIVFTLNPGTNGSDSSIGFVTNKYGVSRAERLTINSTGNVGINTTSPTALLDVNGDTIRLRTARTPASATATGSAGETCWDDSYIYICTATNTWKRAAIATW